MVGIPGTSFTDEFQVSNWLRRLPSEVAATYSRIIAVRTLLRALPFFGSSWHEKRNIRTLDDGPLISIFRASQVAWLSCAFPETDLRSLADSAANALDVHRDPLSRSAYYVARSVFNPTNMDFCESAVGYAAHSFPKSKSDFWQAVTADTNLVDQDFAIPIFATRPLWDVEIGTEWTKALREFWQLLGYSSHLEASEQTGSHWQIWAQWYRARVTGEFSFGLGYGESLYIDKKIAEGNKAPGFWLQSPAKINLQIADWVEESKLQPVLMPPPEQEPGLKFALVDRKVRLARGERISESDDSNSRAFEQLPVLARLVRRLESRLKSDEMPRAGLVDSLNDLHQALSRNGSSAIGVSELYTLTLIFRDQMYEAQYPGLGANVYPFTGADLASAKSIVTISDMIVLATAEGQELFDDADRSELDAGSFEKYRQLERDLLDRIGLNGSIMDAEELELLKSALTAGNRGPVPLRALRLSQASVRNVIFTVAGVGIVGGIGFAVFTAPVASIAVSFLGRLVFGEAIKKSKIGSATNEKLRQLIDKSTVDFVIKNRENLKKIAGDRKSYQWLRDAISWIEKNANDSDRK